jgi:putative transcriptional regulator
MNEVYESIKKGLEEAIAFAEGKKNGTKVHHIRTVDVKKLRVKIGATPNAFATAFGISLTTLQRWEKGDQSPRGPALILLNLLQKEPRTFRKVLSIEP